MMQAQRVMRPRLKRQIHAYSPQDAERRASIFKDNISRFFVYLDAAIYGGRIIRNPWGNNLHFHSTHGFSPDIIRIENGRRTYVEDKATSTKSSKIGTNSKQTANNLYKMLRLTEKGREPFPKLEYDLFKYGPRSLLNGLGALDNSELVNMLATLDKSLIRIPFNLFLYLLSFARIETRDQTTSLYNVDSPMYHIIGGRVLTELLNGTPLNHLNNGQYSSSLVETLRLADLEVEHLVTPSVQVNYRRTSRTEPFQVARYFIPDSKYGKWISSLRKNHKEITDALGLRNLFEEARNVPSDIPF